MAKSDFLYGSNAVFIEEIYQNYLKNPNSVDASWKQYFAEIGGESPKHASWGIRANVVDNNSLAPQESKTNGHANGRMNGHNMDDAPRTPTIFEPVIQDSPSTSPAKTLAINNSASKSTRKPSLVNTSGNIDIPSKSTMAVPISAPASSRNTPSGSPETRPSSNLNAQGDLMRHL